MSKELGLTQFSRFADMACGSKERNLISIFRFFPLQGKIERSLDRGSTLPKAKKKHISPTA
jgi:hypothetical protein